MVFRHIMHPLFREPQRGAGFRPGGGSTTKNGLLLSSPSCRVRRTVSQRSGRFSRLLLKTMKTYDWYLRAAGRLAMLTAIWLALGTPTRLGAQFGPPLPEPNLPPPTGACFFPYPLVYPSGIHLGDLSLLLPTASQPPPVPGTSQSYSFQAAVRGRVSTDGGNTFSDVVSSADVVIHVTADATAQGSYDTEMLSLTLTGGSLPAGVMIRESPTLASTGKTRISPVSGAFQINSFFDVFTELSLDGGQNWAPANGGSRCFLKPLSPEGTFASPNLPPRNTTHAAATPINSANGVVIRNLALSEFTQSQPPPAPGGFTVVTTTLTVRGDLSLNGGQDFAPFTAPGSATTHFDSFFDSGSTRYFDTEMLQLSISGGTLPAGLLIRESPTLPSRGRTSIRELALDDYRIGSFFDIFTEISLDGGQNWTRTRGSCVCSIAQPQSLHENFFTNDVFPLAGTYGTDGDASVNYGNGVVIRHFRHRPNAPKLAPPAPGATQTRSLNGSMELSVSRDGGQTFNDYYVITLSDCLVSGYSVSGGSGTGGDRPMESLSLNFTIISPGQPNIMFRESPTLQSKGKTSVRLTDGGYLIDSFFDIFTEISLDGGQTWSPGSGALHAGLLPYVEQTNLFGSNFLPPRDGSHLTRHYTDIIRMSNGAAIRNVRLHGLTRSLPAPAPGAAIADLDCDGRLDFEISTDSGFAWTQVSGPLAVRVAAGDVNGDGVVETQLAAMTMQFMAGGVAMMIRESPTRQSTGRARITPPMTGMDNFHQIDSFFDIFTELSVDSGQTWFAAENAAHLELHAKPPEVFRRSDWVPLSVQYRETDFNFVCRYNEYLSLGGVIIVLDGSDMVVPNGPSPFPNNGQSLTKTITSDVSLNLSLDGGQTFVPATATAYYVIKFQDLLVSSWNTMNTEMLHLSITGGTLPPGVMIRESPTRASLGRTSIRAEAGGYRIGSFFDIFTELSVDGGQTWVPSSDPLRVSAAHGAPKKSFGSAMIRAEAPLAAPPGGKSLRCATGKHIMDGKITRSSTGGVNPPSPGQSLMVQDNATLEFLYSNDDGQTFTPVRAPAFFQYELKNVIVSSYTTSYDTEMLQLSASGGSLPAGVRIRESPSRPSLGSRLMEEEGIYYYISSFFDVFTEISLDDGQTWEPFDAPMRYELKDVLISSIQAKNEWPPAGHFRSPPPGDPDFDLLLASGMTLSFFDVFVDAAAPTTPLPGPGQSAIYDWQAQGRITIAMPDGVPVEGIAAMTLSTRVSQQGDLTGDGIRTFDTEMLQLSLQGGSLPPGLMIRESPTKASVGRLITQARADGQFGTHSFFDVFVEASEDGGVTWSPGDAPLSLNLAGPEIAIEQPAGTDLTDASATVPYGVLLTGTTLARTFTVKNTATGVLTGLGITIDGAHPSDFAVTASPSAPVAPGDSTTFTVRFAPSVAGMKSADVHIASNDSDESPFDIHLVGRAVLPNADDDGDGVSNGDESNLAAFGFDFLVDSSDDIAAFRSNGFYRTSDVQALNLDVPLLVKDPATGEFKLTLGIGKSTNLLNFSPFPMSAPQTLINGDGKLEFRFTVPDNASFFRVQAP